jgi:hypothetical protein
MSASFFRGTKLRPNADDLSLDVQLSKSIKKPREEGSTIEVTGHEPSYLVRPAVPSDVDNHCCANPFSISSSVKYEVDRP